ncbi:sulfite exporter TauE/SafE family protein [Flammeovirgaceae bacterium SG7u.111]|nr:sulfite exporter TauE/SafE family protein [Flammeovirgaceae bacterium SG7u.132]WPO34954.1 sulfite exporter TauE/SafE family protein [Flammeovirgaceae bacterium SG7u.111]
MNEFFQITQFQGALVLICGLLIGLSKSGVRGAGMIVVPIMASIYGGKLSSGVVLPMLSFADLFAVMYYNRHAEWKYVWKLLPWTMAGIGIGVVTGEAVSDVVFKQLIGAIVIVGLGIMVWQDIKRKKSSSISIPDAWYYSALFGLAGGFSTMIGNSAGAIMAIYLLSMHLPKNSFIGTGAWFFLIVNLSKIPFHALVWKTITLETLTFNLTLTPLIAVGAFIGIKVVKKIPERPYRIFVICITFLSSVLLFI